MTFFWAWLAGALTLINPCVLPLLPIVIAGSFQIDRHGPIYMAAGLTLSFTVLGVSITAFGHLVGLNEAVINRCLLYTSPSPRDKRQSRMPSSA